MIIELCLCVTYAQGVVEKGFSHVRRIMQEQRCSLNKA